MRIIKNLFSSPAASVICILFSILARTGFLRIFLKIGPDKSGLILMTRNWLSGHGLTINAADAANLGQITYEHFYRWPPAYNVILAPVLWLLKDDHMMATFLVDITINILFFIYLRKLLLLVGFPVWLTNCFLIFQALSIQPYFVASNPTDFIGMAFLTMSIYHIVRVTKARSFSGMHGWAAGIFLAAAALTRYHYIPVSLVLALLLLWQGYFHKYAGWKNRGVLVCALVPVIIGSILLLQKLSSGAFVDMVSPAAGFFPSNLLLMHPYIVGSFINLNFYAMQLSQALQTGYSLWTDLARIITIVLSVALLVIYAQWLLRNRKKINSSSENFWLFGGMACLLSVGVLVGLSLFRSKDMGPPLFNWTFVMEQRYFAFPLLFFPILAWHWLFSQPAVSIWKKILKWVLIITVVVEMAHGIYFLIKKLSEPMPPVSEVAWVRPEVAFTKQFIEEQQAKGNKVVVTSFVRQFGFVAGWYGAAAIFNPLQINNEKPGSKEPAVLLAIINKKELPYFSPFLSDPGARLLHTVDEYYFYTLYVGGANNK
jgi:hypothetical protein